MPTWNDTRVRVDCFSNTIASVRPASGFGSGLPALRAAFMAVPEFRIARKVSGGNRSRSRKCFGDADMMLCPANDA